MLKNYFIYLLVSGLVAGSSYLMSNNLIFTLVTLALFLLYFFLYARYYQAKHIKQNKANHDLSTFIHDFIYGYAKNNSLKEGLNEATVNVSYTLVEHLKLLEEYPILDRLEQLSGYFNSPFYLLFLDTVRGAHESGNDILKSGTFLLEENDRLIHERKNSDRHTLKALGEFALLWLIAFLVLIILRFAITNQFTYISTSWIYLVGLGIFYAFFMFSLYLFTYVNKRSYVNE